MNISINALPVLTMLMLVHSTDVSAQGPADSEGFTALKALAGSWTGSTYKHQGERVWGASEAVVTYSLTGAGSALIETLFPGTPGEMTTVYHDDAAGNLVMTHYCNARNQPKMELVSFENNQLKFELVSDADIDAEHEHHAHALTITVGEDGTLQHDWTNHYMGESADLRNIELVRMPQ